MHKKLLIFLAVAFLVAGTGVADAQTKKKIKPYWIKDQNGCSIWNPSPRPNETVTWSGGCKNGKAHGRGELKWFSDGTLTQHYKTVPNSDGKAGTGHVDLVEYDKDGRFEFSFVGQWKNGRNHGQGTETWANGDKYVGQYSNGNRTGQGTYTWGPGTKWAGGKYVGQWKNGKQHGQGSYTWADGGKYLGQWKIGKKHGHGTKTWANGSKYVGQFRDDQIHGQGTTNYPNGNKYVGQFGDGKLHGQGTFTWTNGNKYVGQYRDNEKHGQGTFTLADGSYFKGEFRNDKRWNGTQYDSTKGQTFQIVNGRWAVNGQFADP